MGHLVVAMGVLTTGPSSCAIVAAAVQATSMTVLAVRQVTRAAAALPTARPAPLTLRHLSTAERSNVADKTHPFFATILTGAEEATGKEGRMVVGGWGGGDAEKRLAVRKEAGVRVRDVAAIEC